MLAIKSTANEELYCQIPNVTNSFQQYFYTNTHRDH